MSSANNNSKLLRFPVLQGLLPIKGSQVPLEIVAGLTLAALAIPEVMGYTKISGTPVITGLYTMLVPMLLFAFIGLSRYGCGGLSGHRYPRSSDTLSGRPR